MAAAARLRMATGRKLGRIRDPPHVLSTLEEYRRRHAQYKTDPQLQAAHARAPWIVVWDDHEVADNSWHGGGGGSGAPATTSSEWRARKAAGLRAYYEWMPIRELLAHDDLRLACRTFRFGDPAELIMVETRLAGRDEALDYEGQLEWQDGQPVIAPFLEKLNDPGRQMLGPWQERWLGDTLAQSTSDGERWQVLATRLSWHAWPPRTSGERCRPSNGSRCWKVRVPRAIVSNATMSCPGMTYLPISIPGTVTQPPARGFTR